jgi:polysaccharide export outer membrane protein
MMNKFNMFFALLLSVLFTSCIPTKDLIYLQDKSNGEAVSQSVEAINQKPYRLQLSDVINVNIKSLNPELTSVFNATTQVNGNVSEQTIYMNGYHVDDHGNIRLPILGEVNVLGRTTEEVREIVEKRLLTEQFTPEAGIFVTVRLAGFRYVANGEVGSTGTKVLLQERVNILEAIANSGDINITGDRKDVIVMRRFPHGMETFHIDLTDVNAMKSPVYNLHPNDYIYVKPLKQKTWGTGKTGIESLSTFITLLSVTTTVFLLLRK